ncbi:MAG: metallophosphoesterase [Chloroflexia bacterium]|nr:metallophosphoesterase [Chloroflexia bacterium]
MPIGIRIAATGDLHVRGATEQRAVPGLWNIEHHADLLIIAGDLTENGRLVEAEATAALLREVRIPVVAVLGNHDLRSLRRTAFRRALECAGIDILDGQSTIVQLANGTRVGIAGATGTGGGFWPIEGPNALHNGTLKRLALKSVRELATLERCLRELDADVRIVTMHYAPTTSTLGREPLAKYWMLGNSELGAVIDKGSTDLVIHGHAHLGTLKGQTPGGVPVWNVALPVVGRIFLETLKTRCSVHHDARNPSPVVQCL